LKPFKIKLHTLYVLLAPHREHSVLQLETPIHECFVGKQSLFIVRITCNA